MYLFFFEHFEKKERNSPKIFVKVCNSTMGKRLRETDFDGSKLRRTLPAQSVTRKKKVQNKNIF